jgi:hypothetical protein
MTANDPEGASLIAFSSDTRPSHHSRILGRPLTLFGIGAAAIVLTLGVVRADELKPIEALSVDLKGVFGTAYYTVERDGFHVITTLAHDERNAAPVRAHAVLVSGQSVTFSTPGAVGVAPEMITIERRGDSVLVRRNPELD